MKFQRTLARLGLITLITTDLNVSPWIMQWIDPIDAARSGFVLSAILGTIVLAIGLLGAFLVGGGLVCFGLWIIEGVREDLEELRIATGPIENQTGQLSSTHDEIGSLSNAEVITSEI